MCVEPFDLAPVPKTRSHCLCHARGGKENAVVSENAMHRAVTERYLSGARCPIDQGVGIHDNHSELEGASRSSAAWPLLMDGWVVNGNGKGCPALATQDPTRRSAPQKKTISA
jgi:hypothetical protein